MDFEGRELMRLLIKGGRIIDPANQRDEVADLLVEEGKIVRLEKEIEVKDAQIIEAKGLIVAPGLIDVHTHLREPGYEYKETIATGTRAAAKGGFTTIFCMANTNPVVDNRAVVEFILKKAKEEGVVNLFPVGALSKNLEGKELAEVGEMKKAGIIALSDDGNCIENAYFLRRGMEYAKMFDLPVISHCEDKTLAEGGVMNEGYSSTLLGLKGIPSQAETIIIFRDISLSELSGCQLHIAHLSSAESVELVRQAKKKGKKISCEVTPHHFTLTDSALKDYDTNLKVNPPLRTKEDLKAILEGLKDGTIDLIASDHAPHALEEKEVEFDYAPFGMIGLETTLGLIISKLVNNKILSISEALAKLTSNPARIFGLNKGSLSIGADADITIIDKDWEWIVAREKFASKSKNSPFGGWKLKGKAVKTIVGGEVVL